MGLEKEDILALIAILQKGLDNDQESNKPKAKKQKPSNKVKPIKKHINKFNSMDEFNMCKEDLEVDKKIRKPSPSARNREFDFVNVQCRVCGKQEKVAPMLVEAIERYKCNKCSTGAG